MKRRILVGVVCVGVICILNGCHGKEDVQERLEESIRKMVISETTESAFGESMELSDLEVATTVESEEENSQELVVTQATEANLSDLSTIDEGWRSVYQGRVNEMQGTEFADTVSIILHDIDNDGVPEMITTSVGESDMYTYADGQLISLGYDKGYYPCQLYFQNNTLYSVDSGFDVLSGTCVNLAHREGNQMIETYYFFHWDENYYPIAYYSNGIEESMISYETAKAELEAQGVYVSFESHGDDGYDRCLVYSVTFANANNLMWLENVDMIEEAIRNW